MSELLAPEDLTTEDRTPEESGTGAEEAETEAERYRGLEATVERLPSIDEEGQERARRAIAEVRASFDQMDVFETKEGQEPVTAEEVSSLIADLEAVSVWKNGAYLGLWGPMGRGSRGVWSRSSGSVPFLKEEAWRVQVSYYLTAPTGERALLTYRAPGDYWERFEGDSLRPPEELIVEIGGKTTSFVEKPRTQETPRETPRP